MSQPRTVLILGAGSSFPYGFPIGEKLKAEIIEKTNKERKNVNQHVFDSFIEAGFSEEQVDNLHTALHWAFPKKSIDSFLEERPDLRDIGSFAIANILMHLENPKRLATTDNWYRHLWTELDINTEGKSSHIIGIITFNYERSLDYFLYKTLTEVFHPSKHSKLVANLKQVPLLHVHGDFGEIVDPDPTPYTSTPVYEHIVKASKRIALVHDDLFSNDIFIAARDLLRSSQRAIFLGFGYDKRNLERLGVGSAEMNSIQFLGTTWDLHKEDLSALSFMHEKAFAGPKCDCKTYLTQHLKNQFPE